jgi:hypothetical protein
MHGSVAILTKPDSTATPVRRAAQRACRAVALQVLAQMLDDSRRGALMEQNIRLEIDGQTGQHIGPVADGWYGYGFGFDWRCPLDLSLPRVGG